MTRTHSPRSTSHSRIVPSSLPLSRWRLSGVKASPFTAAACPCSTVEELPAFPCHSRMVWSKLPLATVRPSGLQATHCTCSVWPESCWRRRPSSPNSHSLTLPSQLALARLVPSGAKASPHTQLLCPARISTQAALPRGGISHSRLLPVAQYCPLGLMTTAVMASKASVKAHSQSLAPASVVSCISTPCK